MAFIVVIFLSQFQTELAILIPAHFGEDRLSLCKYYLYIVAVLVLVTCLTFVAITARVLVKGGRLPCAGLLP
jgi:hypothetical protein